MQRLNGVHERRTVVLSTDIISNLDDVVGSQTYERPVKCCVMQCAQREAVANMWLSLWMSIWNDVSRIQKLLMPEPAKRTLPMIRLKNTFAKRPLVQPYSNRGGYVVGTNLFRCQEPV
ncbi:MAG: hypothetical protein A3F84_01340 [Candidatus Handelsmanbacteria bacterium RIFCSPLOWO2_12_FULL_64_10]|uniref:Uncharacterized protein n=1 Tax=Handelsmanbacteria sp. (strain RIFCSPLOWO2_12_FULL_64_10) TaxID=1817868 RepID=A0A1F6D3R7_HANXR|nr:MAG: hypothetical protein A3F84_01340 [Candidatus Handelsmanbacteria bacterium RIFCSPLOWO2_12_FULL_64_10]